MDSYAEVYASVIRVQIEKLKRKDPCPQQVLEYLYIGSAGAATNIEVLKSLQITHILSVCECLPPAFPDEFEYKVVPVEDSAATKISKHFKATNQFIHAAAQAGGKVLVHCLAGVSRSATVVLAYLMKHGRRSLREALDLLRASRARVNPNISFMAQLQQYEAYIQRLRLT